MRASVGRRAECLFCGTYTHVGARERGGEKLGWLLILNNDKISSRGVISERAFSTQGAVAFLKWQIVFFFFQIIEIIN